MQAALMAIFGVHDVVTPELFLVEAVAVGFGIAFAVIIILAWVIHGAGAFRTKPGEPSE